MTVIYSHTEGEKPHGKQSIRRIQTMMKKAKTYLASIQAAATERELTGIELMFTERQNDEYPYQELASQADFDRF